MGEWILHLCLLGDFRGGRRLVLVGQVGMWGGLGWMLESRSRCLLCCSRELGERCL